MLARRLLAPAALLAVGALGASLLSSAGPAGATARPARTVSTPKTVASGVTTWKENFRTKRGQAEQAVLVQVRMSKHVSLRVRTPGELIGGQRVALSTMANSVGAVAGINGDFFDLWSDTAVPRGTVIDSGQLIKSPRPGRLSNVYLRSDGHVAIGAIQFNGQFTRLAATGRPALTHRIYSVNTLDDAINGKVTLVTPDDVGGELDDDCVVVHGSTVGSVRTVTSVVYRTRIGRPPAGRWALVGCWNAADWLHANLRKGDHLRTSLTFPNGTPQAAVTGRRVLVRNGRVFDDPTGSTLSTSGPNPESFACVSKDGLTLLLGEVDGRLYNSVGLTFKQLTDYMLQLKCWTGVVLDGGGSAEMVARLPGHSSVSVLNRPSDGWERRIADSLVVVVH